MELSQSWSPSVEAPVGWSPTPTESSFPTDTLLGRTNSWPEEIVAKMDLAWSNGESLARQPPGHLTTTHTSINQPAVNQPAVIQPFARSADPRDPFPRVTSSHQAPGKRAAFSQFYPNGLPVVYKMLETPGPEGVQQTYLEDYLPVGFYTNPPPNARAIFSSNNGEQQFRTMQHLLPQRRIHLWTADEIQSVCNSLRQLYWEHMRRMLRPYCWDILWNYFDAHDLYHYGALNLWNVIHHLFDENQIIMVDAQKAFTLEIGKWADDWIANTDNQSKLLKWEPTESPFVRLMNDEDWESLGNIQDDHLTLIASALKHRQALLRSTNTSQVTRPEGLVSACQANSLENWLAGSPVLSQNGMPPPPESSPHHCSPAEKNAAAPITVDFNGCHYYLPPPEFQGYLSQQLHAPKTAVQALHESALAAVPTNKPQVEERSGLTIAHGSNYTPSHGSKGSNTLGSNNSIAFPGSATNGSPLDGSAADGSAATCGTANLQQTPPVEQPKTPPRNASSYEFKEQRPQPAEAPTPPPRAYSSSDGGFEGDGDNVGPSYFNGSRNVDSQLTPTKTARGPYNNPRSVTNGTRAETTKSLPASAVLDYVEVVKIPVVGNAAPGTPDKMDKPSSSVSDRQPAG